MKNVKFGEEAEKEKLREMIKNNEAKVPGKKHKKI